MSKKDFEKYMTGKVTKAMLALSMMSHLSYAQAHHENDDIPKEKTENIKSSQSDEISPAEKSFIFEQQITSENGRQDTTYLVNGEEIWGSKVEDVRKLTKEYKEKQEKAFKDKEFSANFYETDVPALGGYYHDQEKSVNIAFFQIKENEEATFKHLKQKYGDKASDEELREASEMLHQAARQNSLESSQFFNTAAHEFQHKNNDKHNIYAPGMTPEQYGQLNQYDEISANLAGILVLNNIYENKLAARIPQSEALKIFDNHTGLNFNFYKNALQNGLKPDSDEARQLMLNGTIAQWKKDNQEVYEPQIANFMFSKSKGNDIGSLAIGNDKEFKKRINLMFDNLGENEVLKKMRIAPGKFSQYLPEEVLELSPKMKKEANDATKLFTGLSLEEGKEISRRLPGSQKKDAINLVKILSGRTAAPKSLTQKKSTNSPQAMISKKYEQSR